jgi:hypothetical protein
MLALMVTAQNFDISHTTSKSYPAPISEVSLPVGIKQPKNETDSSEAGNFS